MTTSLSGLCHTYFRMKHWWSTVKVNHQKPTKKQTVSKCVPEQIFSTQTSTSVTDCKNCIRISLHWMTIEWQSKGKCGLNHCPWNVLKAGGKSTQFKMLLCSLCVTLRSMRWDVVRLVLLLRYRHQTMRIQEMKRPLGFIFFQSLCVCVSECFLDPLLFILLVLHRGHYLPCVMYRSFDKGKLLYML